MSAHGNKRWLKRAAGVLLVGAVAAALVVACTNAAVIATSKPAIDSIEETTAYDADAIVVLGASVLSDGTPSRILQDRLDVAIELYLAGAAPKLIMSGDNSTVSYNEVRGMKNYAISQGVPSEDVFCDHAGFSTYETMYRAKHVFGAERIIIATQTYHLYRAIYDANGLGMEAVGVASDSRSYSGQTWYDLREIPARTKDFFYVIAQTPSTFVGDSISLHQSGDVTD